jgi:formylglycine-generating enzyme required for sulfatase activity
MNALERYVSSSFHLPLDMLFETLREQGFSFGVDTWEMAHYVTMKVVESDDLACLDLWLCPVLAHSAEQQAVFLELCKRLFIPLLEKQIATEKRVEMLKEHEKSESFQKIEYDSASARKQIKESQEKIVASLKSRSGSSPAIERFVQSTDIASNYKLIRVIRLLRFTELSGKNSFNIEKTIEKTIHGAGMARPVYTASRRHIEYLMLIDRHNSRDHLAHLYNNLYESMQENNIYAERFYFDNTPLLCHNHRYASGISLQEILSIYEHAVLLIFTNGLQFIDTSRSGIYPWVDIFRNWQHRYFFSTSPPAIWGERERLLKEVFPLVLPFSIEGIETVASDLLQTANSSVDRISYWQNSADYSLVPIKTEEKTLDYLELFFSEPIKRWIAACAVYPELNWNLTLALGKLFSNEHIQLSSYENISQLLRLDWFSRGYIPDKFRMGLLTRWLSGQEVRAVHQFLYDQLSRNQPLPGEPDFDSRNLQLAVYGLLAEINKEKFQQKAGQLAELLEKKGRLPDIVSIHLINEHEHSPIYFEIPDHLLLRMGIDPAQARRSKKMPPDFVHIRGGPFTMGSSENERDHFNDETQHQVKVDDFYMCKYAVTVAGFKKFIEASGYLTDAEKENYSYIFDGKEFQKKEGVNWRHDPAGNLRQPADENNPVLHVSWNDADAFCDWLSATSGRTFRLPTEAEWEYACRAGTTTPFNTGRNLTTDQANYDGNYPYNDNSKGIFRKTTVAVDSFAPNEWGLYNMHGNVWEWCGDWYGEKYYDECKVIGVIDNPKGPKTRSRRVLRGGGWDSDARGCRSAYRAGNAPDNRYDFVGFRLVCVP